MTTDAEYDLLAEFILSHIPGVIDEDNFIDEILIEEVKDGQGS